MSASTKQNPIPGQKPAKQATAGNASFDDDAQYGGAFPGDTGVLIGPARADWMAQQQSPSPATPFGFGQGFGGLAAATTTPTAPTSGTSAAAAASSTAKTTTPTGSSALPSWVSTLLDSTIKTDMTTAVADGIISEVEMAKVFTDIDANLSAGKTTLSASQFADLKTVVSDLSNGVTTSSYVRDITTRMVNGDASNATWTGGGTTSVALGNLGVGTNATQLSELIGKWYLGTDLPNATVRMSGVSAFSVTYRTVTAPVFAVGGPSMTDVNQGYLGDCYLLSALAEVAKNNPSIITSMIQDNGNNTYGVRFYVGGKEDWVTVNNALANGGQVFNSGTDMWASLVEKAYAQIQASGVITGNSAVNYGDAWSTIGNGGMPDFALQEVSGATAITEYYASGKTWSQYTYSPEVPSYQATGSSGLTTATILGNLTAAISKGYDIILTSRTNAYDSAGKQTLVANHAMSVIGYDSATGNLIIRNPWGTATGQTWATTFEVGMSTLLAAGDAFSVDNVATAPAIAPPVLASQTGNQVWQTGQKVSFALQSGTFTDPQGQKLTLSATLANGQALPSWLSFNAATGTFSGTVPANMPALSIKVTATDTSGLSASETFSAALPAAPTLAAQTATQTWALGTAVNFTLAAGTFADPQGSALTYSATLSNGQALPSWLKFNTTTGAFSGTVAAGTNGLSVKITATDAYGLSASETFSVATPPLAAPKLNAQTANVSEMAGQAFTYALASNTFVDPQGSALTYTATQANGQALPTWMSFNAATETFSGTPPINAGTVSVKVTATDAYGLGVSETFSITTTAPKVPVLTCQTANQTWTVGQAVSFSLAANTFTDTQAMTYSAYQLLYAGDQAATSWLRFDPASLKFSGTVASTERGTLHLEVIAKDASGATATDYFDVNFKNTQGILVSAVSAPPGSSSSPSFTTLAASS
jgi:hypothetical protein